jgi:2-iminobutanoate/2-iminopropanoate deaminase
MTDRDDRLVAERPARQRLMPEGHWDWHVRTPFSQGWRVEPTGMVFVGGQLALDENGEVLAPGDIEAQTEIVFENITKVLREGGATWRDVVKINTFYVFDGDPSEARDFWAKMTKVRMRYLPDEGPCGTGVRVVGLMYDGLLIEVEVIAVVDDAPHMVRR